MNKTLKVLPLGALLVMSAAALSACGSGPAADLTYICPSVDNNVMTKLVADFKEAHPEYADKNIALQKNLGEGETKDDLHKDLAAAADVMLMADDNIRNAVKAEELQSWTAAEAAAVAVTDGAPAVEACSIDGVMYGLPYRGDNSPMMLYDSTKISAANLGSIEAILAECQEKGLKFYMDLGNGWYNPFMIWAGTGSFEVGKDSSGNDQITLHTDRDAEDGLSAADSCQAVYDLYGQYKTTIVSSSTTATIENGFGDGTIGVAFMWNDLSVINQKNPNVTAAKWPTMNIKGVATQLECWQSYKAVVVKAELEGERLTLAKDFAKFMASKSAQQYRLEQLGYGPSNLEVSASSAATALPFVKAIGQMVALNATHSQAAGTTGDFWTPIGNFGGLITDQKNWGDYGSAARALKSLASNSGWTLGA